jgi:hypothetical protein
MRSKKGGGPKSQKGLPDPHRVSPFLSVPFFPSKVVYKPAYRDTCQCGLPRPKNLAAGAGESGKIIQQRMPVGLPAELPSLGCLYGQTNTHKVSGKGL